MNYKTDIEIAQEHTPEFIMNIASRAHIDEKYVEQYGRYKAKIDCSVPVSYTHLTLPTNQ